MAAFPQEYSLNIYIEESPEQNVKDIKGALTNKNKCKGFCNYNVHRGYLSFEDEVIHRCIEKECVYYYDFMSEENEIKKDKIKNIQTQRKVHQRELEEIKTRLNSMNIDGFKIMKVEPKHSDIFTAEYIAMGNIDEAAIVELFKQKANLNIELNRRNVSFDVLERLFG